MQNIMFIATRFAVALCIMSCNVHGTGGYCSIIQNFVPLNVLCIVCEIILTYYSKKSVIF